MDASISARIVLKALLAIAMFLIAERADAASRKQIENRSGVYDYGPDGPNSSYRSGPRTRVYITKRSWLDAGTEVLPGDRKFTDYAFPPGQSFGRENKSRPLDRQPLNPSSDMGGATMGIPLSW
jgi:hypothetical protein